MSQNREHGRQSAFSGAALPPPQKGGVSLIGRRVRHGLIWCLSFGIATFCLANLVASWLLRQELAAIIQRGEPVQLSALVPPTLPDSRNAAPLYLRAAEALPPTKPEGSGPRTNTDAEPDPAMRATHQAIVELLRQASGISSCRFPVDYGTSNPANILLPHLPKMRKLAEVVRAHALRESRTGRVDEALQDVAVLFRMSEHLAPEPILISALTAIAIERSGYATLAQILQDATLTPARARVFALALPQTDWTAALRHALLSERCMGLWAFQYVSNPIQVSQLVDGPVTPSSTLLMRCVGAVWSPLWKLDEVTYLRTLEQQREALLKPGAPLASNDPFFKELPWYAACTRVMLPAMARVARKRDAALAYRRMALVALSLSAHRTLRGKYPASLEEAQATWGAPLPNDLLTNQPFIYRNEDEKALLYSIGPDGQDNGGKTPERTVPLDDGTSERADVVWGG